VAASNYSVNIKLNTKPAVNQLGKLEKRVNTLRKNLNTPLRIESKAVLLKKQQLALDDRKFATMKITRRLGDQVRKFEEQGLKLDKLRLELKNAARHTDKGRLETARSANKVVADELKALEKALQANIQSAGVDRDRIKTLGQIIALKRTEASLNKTAGKTAAFMDSGRRGVGPNNLLGLPSSKMLNARNRGIQVLDPLSRSGSTGFTAAQYGPQLPTANQLKALGTGPVSMDIDTRYRQQTARLKIAHDLNMLELKGVNITQLRNKLGKLTDAQRRKEFGTVKRLNRELTNGIKKENNKLAILREQERINKKRAKAIAAANPSVTGRKGGGGAIFQSALISGGFPLLFGQGPVTAVGGALGGGIGAAVGGQMGGFAGGIVGTAVVQTITNVVNGINELGGALADPANNIDKLTESLSKFDKNIITSVQILQSAGLTASAGQFARARFGTQFGAGGANSLEEMNKAFKEFAKITTKLGTELAILASGPLTGFMKMLNFVLGGGGKPEEGESLGQTIDKTIRKREKAIQKITDLETSLDKKLKRRNELKGMFGTKEEQRKLSREGRLGNVMTEFSRLGGEISSGQLDVQILKDNVENFEATVKLAKLQQKILKETEMGLRAQIDLEKARFEGSEEELIVLEQRAKIKKLEFGIEKQTAEVEAVRKKGSKLEIERAEQTLRNLELQLDLEEQITLNRLNAADPAISRMRDLNKEMRELNDISRQSVELSKIMGSSFEDSFKGIVKGTMTVQDAFRNMLNRIADFFLDTAAQLAANQLQKGVLGLFSNLFNFNTTPLNDIQSDVRFAANGGPVGRRNPYIVGERGPELFVPNQSGNIIPNHDLAGIGGGATNIVVNVDASGSSVEGDEQQGRELGRLISVAVQSELIQQKRPGGLLS